MAEGKQATGKVHFGYFVVAAMVLTSFIPLSLGLSCVGIFHPALSDYLDVERGMLSYYTSVLWVAALVTLSFLAKQFLQFALPPEML